MYEVLVPGLFTPLEIQQAYRCRLPARSVALCISFWG